MQNCEARENVERVYNAYSWWKIEKKDSVGKGRSNSIHLRILLGIHNGSDGNAEIRSRSPEIYMQIPDS